MAEAVLHRGLGGPAVMYEQLTRLVDASRQLGIGLLDVSDGPRVRNTVEITLPLPSAPSPVGQLSVLPVPTLAAQVGSKLDR